MKQLAVALAVVLTLAGAGAIVAFAAQGPGTSGQPQVVQGITGPNEQGSATPSGTADTSQGVQEQGEANDEGVQEQGEANSTDTSNQQQGPQQGPQDE